MLETSDEVHIRLTREAGEQMVRRLQNVTSSGASEAIFRDYREVINGINKMSAEALLERAIDPDEVARAAEAGIEQRMHNALKAAWKYVNTPFTSRTARAEVGKYAEAETVAGMRNDMLFALQTAWTFVHGSDNRELLDEMRQLLDPRGEWQLLPRAA